MGGMNVDSLGKIFKMCGPNDSLKLRWQNDADTLNFQCESSDDDRIADFDLKTMQMSASKEGIKFSVQGDVGSGNVMLKPRESEKPEEKVTLTVHEPVTATFALRYLVNFAKA